MSAAVDSIANRSASSTSGGAFGWNLADLHGNVAAVLGSAGSAVSDAFRYDAYGRTVGKTTSSLPTPWRFQGRLQLSTDDGSGNSADLYDFAARVYDPALGVFTSFDTLAGGAQNPITLNRFLYAGANPATLIDPDGHYFRTMTHDYDDYGNNYVAPLSRYQAVTQAYLANHPEIERQRRIHQVGAATFRARTAAFNIALDRIPPRRPWAGALAAASADRQSLDTQRIEHG